jgi:hypothetical protein
VNAPRLSQLASRLLRNHGAGGGGQLGDRAGTIAALELALAARSRPRGPWMLLMLSVAAAAAIALFAARLRAPTDGAVTATLVTPDNVTFFRAGKELIQRPGSTVLAGDSLRARGTAQLRLSTGTTVAIASGGELDVLELSGHQRLALRAGVLRAHVAKLHADQGFSVATPDALVSVRGTEFEVDVAADAACAGRVATRVHVLEGVVTVTHATGENRLTPGQSWRSPCPLPAAAAPVPVASTRSPDATVAGHTADSGRRTASLHLSPELRASASTLAEQNNLFGQALAARRQGNRGLALQRLDALLARFPAGPLAEAAERARRELVARTP